MPRRFVLFATHTETQVLSTEVDTCAVGRTFPVKALFLDEVYAIPALAAVGAMHAQQRQQQYGGVRGGRVAHVSRAALDVPSSVAVRRLQIPAIGPIARGDQRLNCPKILVLLINAPRCRRSRRARCRWSWWRRSYNSCTAAA